MVLNQLKKEFTDIAIRYSSKNYLTASYRNYLFDGVGYISNTIDAQEYIDFHFFDHAQEIIAKDLEIKKFLFDLKDYARENYFSKIFITMIDGKIFVEAYKEVQVELGDKIPF